MKRLSVFLACISIGAMVFAQDVKPTPVTSREGGNWLEYGQQLKKVLALTDEQEKKITTIMADKQSKMERKGIDLERISLDLREELLKDNADINRVKGIIEKKANIMGDIEFLKIKGDLDIKAVLSKEQFEKWRMLVQSRAQMMKAKGMYDRQKEMRPDDSGRR
ncbi:MAG: hypothetical protein AABZ39_03515 [Spirochaetota bacterium]